MIVVDTNIIAYLYLSNERSEQVEELFKKDPEWVAPLLWRSEFRNVLVTYMREGIISIHEARQIMEEASILMDGWEFEVASFQVLELAASSACSAYDCEFVAIAQEIRKPLVTVDKKILKEFPHIAKSLDDYLDF